MSFLSEGHIQPEINYLFFIKFPLPTPMAAIINSKIPIEKRINPVFE